MHPQSSSDHAKFVIQHNTCACMSSIVTCKSLYVTALVNTAHGSSACSGVCDQFCIMLMPTCLPAMHSEKGAAAMSA